jgi:hypothetical protein
MIQMSHILVLSQEDFVERQVRSAFDAGFGGWRSALRAARRRLRS